MNTTREEMALLREFGKHVPLADSPAYAQALARVAAELERLREGQDNIKRDYDDVFGQLLRSHGELARLRDGLRRIAEYYEAEYREGDKAYQAAIIARALLSASQDTKGTA